MIIDIEKELQSARELRAQLDKLQAEVDKLKATSDPQPGIFRDNELTFLYYRYRHTTPGGFGYWRSTSPDDIILVTNEAGIEVTQVKNGHLETSVVPWHNIEELSYHTKPIKLVD